jgi:hypothetical protein
MRAAQWPGRKRRSSAISRVRRAASSRRSRSARRRCSISDSPRCDCGRDDSVRDRLLLILGQLASRFTCRFLFGDHFFGPSAAASLGLGREQCIVLSLRLCERMLGVLLLLMRDGLFRERTDRAARGCAPVWSCPDRSAQPLVCTALRVLRALRVRPGFASRSSLAFLASAGSLKASTPVQKGQGSRRASR